ncbi:DUF2218 domain-containing protein [Halomonas urmiana]|uniref:DUF2218 domain-containing protein n=1 Tax=Halomonas urmiana TaxID=490901 RepID=A0A5R8MMT0_9GAMM|nr:DUF2218 domain-containing protein [Halomonas urmiana]TLF53688.1 DUF2218 domain-containing protein [Halomonas urmiana]
MPISRADIPAEDAKGLIERLCQEWVDTQPIDRQETQVRVRFDEGSCLLEARPEHLSVAVETLDDESLDRLEGKVNAALEGLAGVTLDIVWEN